MTKVQFSPEDGLLSVSGHAGSASYGRDLVCAALSILTETAAAIPGAKTSRGMGCCVVYAEPEQLRVVARGFWLLARDYWDYVEYEEDER